MVFIEVDDLALNGQVIPVIQTKISNKQVTSNYLYLYFNFLFANQNIYNVVE